MADTAESLLRDVAAFWDDERTTLASLRGDESERWKAEGDRLGHAAGTLMRRVYAFLEQRDEAGPDSTVASEASHG